MRLFWHPFWHSNTQDMYPRLQIVETSELVPTESECASRNAKRKTSTQTVSSSKHSTCQSLTFVFRTFQTLEQLKCSNSLALCLPSFNSFFKLDEFKIQNFKFPVHRTFDPSSFQSRAFQSCIPQQTRVWKAPRGMTIVLHLVSVARHPSPRLQTF